MSENRKFFINGVARSHSVNKVYSIFVNASLEKVIFFIFFSKIYFINFLLSLKISNLKIIIKKK